MQCSGRGKFARKLQLVSRQLIIPSSKCLKQAMRSWGEDVEVVVALKCLDLTILGKGSAIVYIWDSAKPY
jgi:hypothetical protein